MNHIHIQFTDLESLARSAERTAALGLTCFSLMPMSVGYMVGVSVTHDQHDGPLAQPHVTAINVDPSAGLERATAFLPPPDPVQGNRPPSRYPT